MTSGTRDDSGGTFTALGDGKYTYKFATVLPEHLRSRRHTRALGIDARRDL